MPITTPHHVLSRCVFIPNKFPTLLAEREIIANASSLVRISPRTCHKGTKNISYQAKKKAEKTTVKKSAKKKHTRVSRVLIIGVHIETVICHLSCLGGSFLNLPSGRASM